MGIGFQMDQILRDFISQCEIIRILHGCEVGIEHSVPRITAWHHEAVPSDAKR